MHRDGRRIDKIKSMVAYMFYFLFYLVIFSLHGTHLSQTGKCSIQSQHGTWNKNWRTNRLTDDNAFKMYNIIIIMIEKELFFLSLLTIFNCNQNIIQKKSAWNNNSNNNNKQSIDNFSEMLYYCKLINEISWSIFHNNNDIVCVCMCIKFHVNLI